METASTSDEGSENPLLTECDNEGGQYDLFLQLQEVISSLETCAWSWRSPSSSMDCSATPEQNTAPSHITIPSPAMPIMQELNQVQESNLLPEEWRSPELPISPMGYTGHDVSIAKNSATEDITYKVQESDRLPEEWRSPELPISPTGYTGKDVPIAKNSAAEDITYKELIPNLLVEDPCWFQSEIARYREQNSALRIKLMVTDRELSRSKTILVDIAEERDRLQAEVNNLQGNLQEGDVSPTSISVCTSLSDLTLAPTPSSRESLPWQESLSTLQGLIHYLQSLPGINPSTPGAPTINASNMETEIERLRGNLEHMKQLNDQLCLTLEECKTDSEKLSMKLGKLESTCTALRLALQSSERCLKTYSVLLALAETKEEILLGSVPGGDFLKSGWSLLPKDLEIKTKLFMREVKKTFRREMLNPKAEERGLGPQGISSLYSPWLSQEEEQTLKDYIRSLKWDLASVTLLGHTPTDHDCSSPSKEVAHLADLIKAKVDEVIKASMEACSGEPQKPQRAQIVQELMDAREALTQIRANLQLLQTENRALEIQTVCHAENEKAYQLIINHLQVELNKCADSSTEEDSGSAVKSSPQESEIPGPGEVSAMTPNVLLLLESLKRSSEMKVCVEGLISELDKLSFNGRAQRVQCAQIITDFFKAHRKLFLTHHNARKKYQEQQRKLESQANLMSQHQRQQLHKLMQNIVSLQGQQAARDIAGETSL